MKSKRVNCDLLSVKFKVVKIQRTYYVKMMISARHNKGKYFVRRNAIIAVSFSNNT